MNLRFIGQIRQIIKTKILKIHNIAVILAFVALVLCIAGCCRKSVRAGAAECDITPPAGYEILHFYRYSIGIHDPLFARCLYIEDNEGSSVAIICLDLTGGDSKAFDELRREIREKTGIEHALINISHSHSSVNLGPRGMTTISNDTNSKWNDQTLDAIVAIVREARKRAEPVSLCAGRAPVQVGFNRRMLDEKTGSIYMDVNREGPVVPWVNVLVANSRKTGKPLAVLFEHAAHPVIVPHTSKLISADYPGAAVKRVREVLGDNVIALFGQGCAGNINGYPLRSSHEKADEAGCKLGNAVLEAINKSDPIESNTFTVKFAQTMLPSAPLPSEEEWQIMVAQNKVNLQQMKQLDSMRDQKKWWSGNVSTFEMRMKQLNRIRNLLDRGEKPPSRRFDTYSVSFGNEWCLTAMPNEMFCEYEQWIDRNAPFKHTMTFAYTNGVEDYIAVDEAWRMGPRGGYEAACLPNWRGQVWGPQLGPPAVGCEKIIKDNIASLWARELDTKMPDKY